MRFTRRIFAVLLLVLCGCSGGTKSTTNVVNGHEQLNDCFGTTSWGQGTVESISATRTGYTSEADHQFVAISFVPSQPGVSIIDIVLTLTNECIAAEKLTVNSVFNAEAWIRTNGTCQPYVLYLTAKSCN